MPLQKRMHQRESLQNTFGRTDKDTSGCENISKTQKRRFRPDSLQDKPKHTGGRLLWRFKTGYAVPQIFKQRKCKYSCREYVACHGKGPNSNDSAGKINGVLLRCRFRKMIASPLNKDFKLNLLYCYRPLKKTDRRK